MSATIDATVRPEVDDRSETDTPSLDGERPGDGRSTLVLSICSVTGAEPRQLSPLSRAVDPDALAGHVRGRERGATLSVEFHGHDVTVRDDGRLEFAPVNEPGGPW